MTEPRDESRFQRAGQALSRKAWQEGFELLSEGDREQELGPEELPMLAQAAYFAGHPEISRDAWERIHVDAIRRGDSTKAAEASIQMLFLLMDAGLLAQFRGWSQRAERLLGNGEADSQLHGMLRMIRGFFSLISGDIDQALHLSREAIETATRFDDRDTVILARTSEARALIFQGHIDEGMALLDETAVAAASGELDPITSALIYCNVVCSWQGLAEYDRAEEWTTAMMKHVDGHDVGGAHGFCRVHRAEILRLRGQCLEAANEAQRALEEIRTYSQGELGWPLNELGVIRMRLGDLPGAEAAFIEAHEAGWEPQPGLALLRLAQGNVEAAGSSIRDALDNSPGVASWELPPKTELRRAPLLAAQVEIAVSAGELEVARVAAGEFEEIAAVFKSKALRAGASIARGSVQMGDGDHSTARASFQEGVRLWTELKAPYETARARRGLAEAYLAAGNEERALLELNAARSTFEKLGAKLEVRRAVEAVARLRPSGSTAERERRVFMFTDIVNSTNLVEVIGDDAWGHLLRWHNQKLAALVVENDGEVVQTTGDGFFVTFETSRSAIECAVAIQRALDEHRRTHGFSPRVRIGLHMAEATREGTDWSGVGVHAAARIGAVAEGDEILLSRETAEAAGDAFSLTRRGSTSLKGISEPVEVVAVEWR